MKKRDVIAHLIPDVSHSWPKKDSASAYAPTNIALCKYWGKRCTELNLPLTDSLSITLPNKGAKVSMTVNEKEDEVWLNNDCLLPSSSFVIRLIEFLNLFRPHKKWFLTIHIEMTIPVAAGLASSACGFASIVLALNELLQWHLSKEKLSILCRLGSGSATRSLWHGFVVWYAGLDANGMDSIAKPIATTWPELKIGILSFSNHKKPISSREAMQRTVETSVLYQNWPQQVKQDFARLQLAIATHDFELLGKTTERNALAMHATMQSSWPPICYHLPETIEAMRAIWTLRREGLELYFTQDAGPNLKLLFESKDEHIVKKNFPQVMIEGLFV